MYQATAAEFIPLPTMEIRLAANTKRSGRSPKLACIVLIYRKTLRIKSPGQRDFTLKARAGVLTPASCWPLHTAGVRRYDSPALEFQVISGYRRTTMTRAMAGLLAGLFSAVCFTSQANAQAD